jgi:hypothetical protein
MSSATTASGSGSDSDWVDSDGEARRQRARHRRRSWSVASDDPSSSAAADELEAGFDKFLASIDDLLGPPQATPHSDAFRPRPGSAWQPVAAAVTAAEQHRRSAEGRQAARGAALWTGLPGGMRTVLQQAAALGLLDVVLQRTAVRLRALLLPPVAE